MKTLSNDELDALNRVVEDVEISVDTQFSNFGDEYKNNLKSLAPIFTGIYFKALNHDPKNKNWKNRDLVFCLNNYSNIIKNIVEVHAGYTDFSLLDKYLLENDFGIKENSFGEAIGDYILNRESEERHQKYYFVVLSELDILSSLASLEFIIKNKMKRIIVIAYTKTDNKSINQENKLNGRLINLGFDTLVISGEDVLPVCDAIAYAKKLEKPSIILANIN
jgi:transketolase N-terminal domain/subunit